MADSLTQSAAATRRNRTIAADTSSDPAFRPSIFRCRSLPDRRDTWLSLRRLRRHVVDHAVDALDFVDDAHLSPSSTTHDQEAKSRAYSGDAISGGRRQRSCGQLRSRNGSKRACREPEASPRQVWQTTLPQML